MRVSASLVHSNVHILIVAGGLICGTWVLLSLPFSPAFLIASCASAFLIYQADRVWLYREEDHVNQPERIAWYRRNLPAVRIGTVGMAVLLLMNLWFVDLSTILSGLVLAVFVLFYLKYEGRQTRGLKRSWVFKPLIIATGWIFGGIILPVLAQKGALNAASLGLAGYRFPLLLANVVVADWPDRHGDAASGLQSLALKLEPKQLKYVIWMCSSLGFICCLIYGFCMHWTLLYYLELIAPLLMIWLATYLESLQPHALVLLADLIVAWPLVTSIIVIVAGI